MNKNDHFTGTCTGYTYDGLGVVKTDTFSVFVKDMIIGETGEIVVTAVRKGYGYGRLLNLIEESPQRIEPKCPVSRQCGGCQFQHMSLKGQAFFKKSHVKECINKIGRLNVEVKDVLTMEEPFRYRNKVQLPVGTDKNGQPVIGFYRYNSHDIIPVEDCWLQSEHSNAVVNKIRELMIRFNNVSSFRHIMLRDFSSTEQCMVVLVTYKRNVPLLTEMVEELVSSDSRIKSVIQNINGEDTNVVLGKRQKLLYGSWYIQDELCGLKFEISSSSFYQVNSRQTEVLYSTAVDLLNLKGHELVMDLYCGVGTIGLIASKKAGKVLGVEIVESAIEDAKRNAALNNIDNVEFFCGDTGDIINKFKKEKIKPDAVIVDPPRKGCSKETIDTLIELKPKKIVYVSCNPSTLARDLNLLREDYAVKTIQPVDMFSQSYHIETVVLLERIGQN